MRASSPARASEPPIRNVRYLTATAATVALATSLLGPAPAAAQPDTASTTAVAAPPAVTPSVLLRAGRDYFRQPPAPPSTGGSRNVFLLVTRSGHGQPDTAAVEVKRRPVVVVVPVTPAPPVRTVAVVAVRRTVPAPPRKTAPPAPAPAPAPAPVVVVGTGKASTVVSAALAQVGRPYVFAAAGPSAFDCSGLVMYAFHRVGINLPHDADAIGRMGHSVPRAQWLPGTVISYPGHVALYIGGGMMVEAAHTGTNVRVVPARPGNGRWLF